MEKIFDSWTKFIDTLVENMPEIISNPLAWGMGLLVLIVFFVLYDLPQDKKNVRRSITGLLRYALRVVLAFTEDLLAAIESVTGFVDVIRVVLKGKLTDGVQFLLGNYAIIALSVASFFTTYNGLKNVIGVYTAALITFGIQVGILAMSSRLALDLNKRNQERVKAFKEIDYFTKKSKVDVKEGKRNATIFNKGSTYSWQVGKQSNHNEVREDGQEQPRLGRKILVHFLLLAFSMIVSIYFSYVYFFEKHIYPSLAMDTYVLTRNTISRITDDYTSKVSEMHTILQRRLQEINQQTLGSIDTAANQQIDSRIEELENQLSQMEQNRENLVNLQAELAEQFENANLEGDTAGAEGIRSRLTVVRSDINELDDKIRDLDTELRNSISDRSDNIEYFDRMDIVETLEELEKFYADPISYMEAFSIGEEENPTEGEQTRESWRSVITNHFDRVISYNRDNSPEEKDETFEDQLTIFNNYADLCEYYQNHGQVGFYNILENAEWGIQEEILEETSEDEQKEDQEETSEDEQKEDQEKTSEDKREKDQKKTSEDEQKEDQEKVSEDKRKEDQEKILKEKQKEEQDARWNQGSATLLQQMMSELNSVPDMVRWNDMGETEQNAVRALSKTEEIKDLYRLYRVSTGHVDILEMVLLKWSMDFNWLLVVILFLAAFVDVLAVILTLVKGTAHYENKLPRYRKLLHRMFIQDSRSEKDKWKIRILQWAGALGTAVGLLAFGLYYKVSGESDDAHLLASLICFVALGALISRIIAGLYRKAHDDAKDWKEEEIYKELRSAWGNQGIETIDDLKAKIEQAHSRGNGLLIKNDEVEWIVRLLAVVESEDIVRVLKPNARLLLRHIGMTRFKKRTWEYYFVNQGLSSAKDYMQGWFDEIDAAYINYEKVREHGMVLPFAVLRAEGLVAYFECEERLEKDWGVKQYAPENAYYILSGRFLRILYELIMEANTGTEFEDDFYIADDLADAYESEEMTED